MEREEGLVIRGRVEIDMRRPFRSVKEAVALFGEKVLAAGIYGNKLKEMQAKESEKEQFKSKFGAVTAELEQTKQSLQKAKEEGNLMAHCLKSLKHELDQTKEELQQLKAAKECQDKQPFDLELDIEELKFIENSTKLELERQAEDGQQLQKKRSVKFASPPSLTRIIVSKDVPEVPEASPSFKEKMKRKPLIPLIGGLFTKKKGVQQGESPEARAFK